MLFAYLLDKNVRGSRIYQSIFYFPVVLSLAVVGFIWKSVMFCRDQGLLNTIWPGEPVDFVGDQTKIFSIDLPVPRLPARAVEELRRAADGDGVAAHRLRDGALPRRAEVGRPRRCARRLRSTAATSGSAFRRVVFPSLKPINVVVAVITRDRGAARLRHRRRAERAAGHRGDGHARHQRLVGEGGGRVGIGSAYGMVLFVLCIGFIIWYVANNFREDEPMTTSRPRCRLAVSRRRADGRLRRGRDVRPRAHASCCTRS